MWKRRLLLLLPTLIFGAAVLAFYFGLDRDRRPDELPSQLLDKAAPAFDLPALEGLQLPGLATADLASDGVTLVNFFASWCAPCRAEHPLLMELASQPGVRLVGIAYKDKAADSLAVLLELGNPFQRVGLDVTGRTAIDWGITGVPETFVLDKAGVIRFRFVGPLNAVDLEKKLAPVIAELLK